MDVSDRQEVWQQTCCKLPASCALQSPPNSGLRYMLTLLWGKNNGEEEGVSEKKGGGEVIVKHHFPFLQNHSCKPCSFLALSSC